MVSGAVNVTSLGLRPGAVGPTPAADGRLVRLNPRRDAARGRTTVRAERDIDTLTPYGTLFVDPSAPGTVPTILPPGS